MTTMPETFFPRSPAGAALAVALPARVRRGAGGAAAAKNRAVFQVTDNDPARWNMILNNMANLRDGVGSEGVEIELVAYGPGIVMLKADSSVKQRIAEALKDGVRINACQNTMSSHEADAGRHAARHQLRAGGRGRGDEEAAAGLGLHPLLTMRV